MKHLPGNPYRPTNAYTPGDPLTGESEEQWVSEVGQTDATLIAFNLKQLTLATMALAYEQRTANLINYLRWEPQGDLHRTEQKCYDEILARLDLGNAGGRG